MNAGWTTPAEVTATLRARWRRGVYLCRYAVGDAWEPVRMPVRGPEADDLLRDHAAVERWSATFTGIAPFVVEHRVVRSRTLGANEVPRRLVVASFDDLVRLLGVEVEVAAFDAALAATNARLPALVHWIVAHPMRVVEHADRWSRLLDVVDWMAQNDGPRFVRHIDVPSVDTKFVEANEKILRALLPVVLPAERVAIDERSFARRFGFLDKPLFTRLRFLDDPSPFPAGVSDVQLRTDELAGLPLPVGTVFVVENEVSYLAFERARDAIVVFGGGFAVTTLDQLGWLAECRLVYWGDIDTHGFAILARLRQRFPHTESILMDAATLHAHRDHLTVEPVPTAVDRGCLRPDERDAYDDLAGGVRLEQERVRFSAVREALASLEQR